MLSELRRFFKVQHPFSYAHARRFLALDQVRLSGRKNRVGRATADIGDSRKLTHPPLLRWVKCRALRRADLNPVCDLWRGSITRSPTPPVRRASQRVILKSTR